MIAPLKKSLDSVKIDDIVFTSPAKNDCDLLDVPLDELTTFVKTEAKNHPKIFAAEFLSISLVFSQFVVLLSWDKSKVTIERLLNREEAYPLNNNWVTCLSLYRQATLLPYRLAPAETIVLSADAKSTIRHYFKLVRSLKIYIMLYEFINGNTGINIADLELLLSEAEFAIANNKTNISIARMETLLSTIHKILVSYAPQTPRSNKKTTSNPKRLAFKENVPAILVIEDDEDWREIIKEMIEGIGIQTYCAGTAIEAMQAMIEHDFDIVITDMLLSMEHADAQDGREIATAAKKSNPKTKVIVLTAFMGLTNAVDGVKKQIYDDIFDKQDLFLKPYDFRKRIIDILERTEP